MRQIDDLRDVLSTEKHEGKTLGTDILQEKFTLAVIHWINQDSSRKLTRAKQEAVLNEPAQLLEQMRCSGSIDYALEQAKFQIEQAKLSLSSLPLTGAKEVLLGFADRIVSDIT